MLTIDHIVKEFQTREWEIEEVSEDSFQRITFDAPTYEICLDGRNVFYMELTNVSAKEEILDGNLFKFEKDGSIVHIWTIEDATSTRDVVEMAVLFDKEN